MTEHRRQRGFSLIEVMIALALGLFTTLAMVQSLSGSETMRLAATGRADAHQAGGLAHWRLGRQLRLAGAGIGQAPAMIGCTLQASLGGAQLLPRPGGWPVPFRTIPATLRLTPLAVQNNAGPGGTDLIVMMGGMTGASVVPSPVSMPSPAALLASGAVGFHAGDLLLVGDAGNVGACQLGQVDGTYAPAFGAAPAVMLPTTTVGAPYNSAAGFAGLPQPGDYQALNLGQNPMIHLFGVNNRGELVVLDALRLYTADTPVPMASSVVQLQALYGVDDGSAGGIANDNVVDSWQRPVGRYAYANVTAPGSPAALEIKAVRVALVMRSKTPNTSQARARITLFEDLPPDLRTDIDLGEAQRRFGYQVFDTVIPLPNQASALCAEFRRQLGVPAAGACT
jgi:type IV pilus assembly protein PilW